MFAFRLGVAAMLFHDASVEANRPCEPRREALIAPSIAPIERGGREFAALSRTPLASQFFSWRGMSGKSYVFTVFAPSYCPAFCDVLLLERFPHGRNGKGIPESV
jgi:hypothetical protein